MTSPAGKAPQFEVYDTTSAAGTLSWAATTGATRDQVLRVARRNIESGVLTPEDVRELVAAGYAELHS